MIEYKTQGVCSRKIEFEIENGILKNVNFISGCSGNSQGIGRLVEGMRVEDVISRLEGIKCEWRNTSCPEQLAKALKLQLEKSSDKEVSSF